MEGMTVTPPTIRVRREESMKTAMMMELVFAVVLEELMEETTLLPVFIRKIVYC